MLNLLNNKKIFFACAESGKEKARSQGGLIDAFAVGLHHRVDKKVAFAIISNDEAFRIHTIKFINPNPTKFNFDSFCMRLLLAIYIKFIYAHSISLRTLNMNRILFIFFL